MGGLSSKRSSKRANSARKRDSRSRFGGLLLITLALAACGTLRPDPRLPVSPTPTGKLGSASSPPLPNVTLPTNVTLPSTAAPTDFDTAALNSRILSQISPRAPEADLPIGPGDLIEVSVFEVEELSKLKLRVPVSGNVTLPLLGQIPAAGRTATDLEEEIRVRLQRKYMHSPQVSIFIHEHQSQRISVIGAVRKGGVYTLASRLRLADALALAEGLTDDADHVIYLIRRVPAGTFIRSQAGVAPTKAPIPRLRGVATEEVMAAIDLEALADGKEELNVALEPGDVIHVPRAGAYYVGGSVERSGSYLLKSKTTVDQAILAAGGVKDVAELEDIRVYRAKPGGGREVLMFNLKEFAKGETAPEIQKNDVIVVGKSASKAFWYGVVDFFKGIFAVSKGL
jgi:polysaccharide export outer membrane protein